eukprot:GCRY01000338.1.p1 GENE.GCRY01000338.1~~GCRY01000338.1.p1  ORF type:complete len:308 (+),score=56.48 GCRY01000338.1:137-1060(+)
MFSTSVPTEMRFGRYSPMKVPSSKKKKPDYPLLVGVTGGTASGKTTVCEKIQTKLLECIEKKKQLHPNGHHRTNSNDDPELKLNSQQKHNRSNSNEDAEFKLNNPHKLFPDDIVMISQDSFYKALTAEDLRNVEDYNFDCPNAFDYDLFIKLLQDLRDRKTVEVPIYDFKTHSRSSESRTVHPANIIIVEGILTLHDERLRDLFDLKIYVDVDSDVRLSRRVERDTIHRGRSVESILVQYERFVKPSFDEFTWPTKKHADVVIPRGAENEVAIDLIVLQLKSKLEEREELKKLLLKHKSHDDFNFLH